MQQQQTIKLTKAEEQIMQIIWKLERGFLKDILDHTTEPKPHSNTVATIIKILIDKGFVAATVYGRSHLYTPLITKDTYSKTSLTQLVDSYFEGNFTNAVTFMVNKKNISINDLELLLTQLKNNN